MPDAMNTIEVHDTWCKLEQVHLQPTPSPYRPKDPDTGMNFFFEQCRVTQGGSSLCHAGCMARAEGPSLQGMYVLKNQSHDVF